MSKIDNKEKKGFKFGRNSGTLLLIIGGLILLFLLISIPYGYISEGNKNDITPYKSKAETINIEKAKRMKGSSFKEMDVEFYCSKYDVEGNTATFSLNIIWNENTSNLSDNSEKLEIVSGSNTVEAYVALCADWVSFETYSTSQKFKVAPEHTALPKTVSLTGINHFPKYAKTWPIAVKVDTPNAYVYLRYTYLDSGNRITKIYILEYTYNDYHTDKTIGGLM